MLIVLLCHSQQCDVAQKTELQSFYLNNHSQFMSSNTKEKFDGKGS